MSRIVGIDLGTSTSEVAYLNGGVPCVIPNHLGEPVTPSAIHIAEDGSILVGVRAKELLLIEPERTFYEVKRLMGSKTEVAVNGKSYSPEKLCSYVLSYLAQCAGEALGEQIEKAVITVPAYFSEEQRRATMEAGRLAGLSVERMINEPTAAALAYGLENMGACKNVLVYDLGGGTLDVTVLEMFEGVLEVRASSGNNHLGGKEFDDAIIDHLLGDFGQNQSYIRGDARAMARLKQAAEQCKIALSQDESHSIELPFLASVKGKPVQISKTVTRETFEALILPMIEGTKEQIISALKDASMSMDELDMVLLVGGSTRIPCVARTIAQITGKEPVFRDPELAVVHGAAVQAGMLERLLDELVLTDVCPYTLGTAVLHDWSSLFGAHELYFDPIIERNTTIPVTVEKEYTTSGHYQRQVRIKVYQGEYSDPERNNYLGEVELSGIPPAPAGKEEISVAFSYDVNGLLQVDATIVSTGKKATVTISTSDKPMVEEVDISAWDKAANAKRYRAVIRRAQKKLVADREDDEELSDLLRALKEALVKESPESEADAIRDDLVAYLMEDE